VKWKRIIDLSFRIAFSHQRSSSAVFFGVSLDYAAHLIWIFILTIESINFSPLLVLLLRCLSTQSKKEESSDWICKRVSSRGNSLCFSEDAKEDWK
jgi:hypothetical protein